MNFNPRTPCGVRRYLGRDSCQRTPDFNPRTPCGVRQCFPGIISIRTVISIHAPRVGCDPSHSARKDLTVNFNPRTPCGVRLVLEVPPGVSLYFNPRTPCGVRLLLHAAKSCKMVISIHAPRVGCDVHQPRPPGWMGISIHAPRVGCDSQLRGGHQGEDGFQSTHPVWGATHAGRGSRPGPERFQSTHPVWGATIDLGGVLLVRRISIHAPRVGCDRLEIRHHQRATYFNPRTPCGVRHNVFALSDVLGIISIHAPRVGCDGRRSGATEKG